MKKTILFWVLVLSCFGLLSAALADIAGDKVCGDFTYALLKDGTVKITGYTGDDEELSVPAELDGYQVTEIGKSAFAGPRGVHRVILPEGLTAIGDYAFESGDLKAIELPSTLRTIGKSAFSYSFVEEIVIPEGITAIEDYTFNISQLTKITLPSTLKQIGVGAFNMCSLEEVVIPSGVTVIDNIAFSYCPLKAITIPDSVEYIGSYAFEECSNVKRVFVPDSVTYIGEGAFSPVMQIIAPHGSAAEAYCTETEHDYVYPEEITTLPGEYISGDFTYQLTKNGTAEIVSYHGCEEYLRIPDNLDGVPVTAIGYAAFWERYSGNEELKSVEIPKSITTIEAKAFYWCENLEEIRFSGSVEVIGQDAFIGCALKNVTLPEGLVEIGSTAFANCKELSGISIPGSVSFVGSNPFLYCFSLTDLQVEGPYLKVVDGVLLSTEDGRLITYPAASSLPEYVVPEGTHVIGDHAFTSCSLNKVLIPDTVTVIGKSAFSGCSALQEIVIPAGTVELGSYAFSECEKLNKALILGDINTIKRGTFESCGALGEVILPDGLISIEQSAFYGCKSLGSIVLPEGTEVIGNYVFAYCEKLKDVSVPDTVSSIGDSTFRACSSLESIALPDSVKYVGDGPFADCENLRNIIVSENHPYLQMIDGALISMTDHRLVMRLSTCTESSFSVPEGVLEIGYEAFYGNSHLKSLTIPEGVVSIGDDALLFCDSLEKMIIPESVQYIGGLSVQSVNEFDDWIVVVRQGSYAEEYCREKGIDIVYDGMD